MTTGRESVDRKKNERLLFVVKAFIEKHDIHSSDKIYQTDSIIEDAYQLIEDLCDVAGYTKLEEDV